MNPVREFLFLLGNTSLAVKVLSLVLLFLYLLSVILPSTHSLLLGLSVTPGYFWPPHFWIWTAFTHCFLEIHFWEVLIDLVVLALVGKLLEPLWGALEMVLFFVVVNVGVAIVSAFFYYLLYMLTFNTELHFDFIRARGSVTVVQSEQADLAKKDEPDQTSRFFLNHRQMRRRDLFFIPLRMTVADSGERERRVKKKPE
jgi:hypothetical protein